MPNPAGSWKEMNISEKFKFLLSKTTVEPIAMSYILPSALSSITTYNINLEKACRVNLAYPKYVCDAISDRIAENYTLEEQEVQKLVSEMNYWQSTLRSALPALLILFVGSFSDRSGRRKPFLLLPMVGELCMSLGLLLCTYYYLEWPMEVAGIIEGLFPALSGGLAIFGMALFSYVADISSESMRTMRIGIVNVCVTIAAPAGSLSSGYLYQVIGPYGVYTISSIIYAIGIVYGLAILKEVQEPKKLQKSFLKEFFDPKHFLETINVAVKKRKGNLRLRILLIMIVCISIMGPISGESAVGYLFGRYRFNWDEVDFSFYTTYVVLLTLLGNTVILGFFTHFLKMDDAMLGIIGCISKIVANCFYAFASTTLIFYLATLLDLVGNAPLLAMRSIASKLVPSEELGKVYSLFGLCEAVSPVIYPPVYSFVYSHTINVLPGAFFLVSAATMVATLLIFGYLLHLHKTDPVSSEQDSYNEKSTGAKTNEAFSMSDDQPNIFIDTKL